jgi:hypothetical protein
MRQVSKDQASRFMGLLFPAVQLGLLLIAWVPSASHADQADVSGSFHSWRILSGSEEEKGENILLLDANANHLQLEVWKRRGHVALPFSPVNLPVEIVLLWRTAFDSTVEEVATELWGTGDFRISIVGPPKDDPELIFSDGSLGLFEGVQFRIFPHLNDSPIRRYTEPGHESHTATSIWMRYTEPERLSGDDGQPHTGLQSDACQNRNKEDGTHNCGWDRHQIFRGGLGIANTEEVEMRIRITRSGVALEANGRRFAVVPRESRFDKISAIVIGITNTSRGYRSLDVSGIKILPLSRQPAQVPAISFGIDSDFLIDRVFVPNFPSIPATLQFSRNLEDWKIIEAYLSDEAESIEFVIPDASRKAGYYRVLY